MKIDVKVKGKNIGPALFNAEYIKKNPGIYQDVDQDRWGRHRLISIDGGIDKPGIILLVEIPDNIIRALSPQSNLGWLDDTENYHKSPDEITITFKNKNN